MITCSRWDGKVAMERGRRKKERVRVRAYWGGVWKMAKSKNGPLSLWG